MACKYKVKGSEEWLSERDFKIKLAQGALDTLMADNNIKIKGLEPTTTKQESAPRAVEQTAPDTSVVAEEKGAATTGVSEYKQTKATVRGASVDGYSVRVSEDGKKAQVKLPNKKESEMLPVKKDSAGREYVIGPNGSTVYLPTAESKVEAKAEDKKEAPQEKKEVRRKPIKGIDKDSSPKAKEIAEKLKFSPNEFTGEQTLEDVGLIDALEVVDKDTGRKVTKMKPMRAIINAAYDKGEITSKERDVLEDALEEKTKAFNEAKQKPKSDAVKKAEEFRDKIYQKIKEGQIEGVLGLNAAIYNKVLDVAAELFKGGMDGYIAIRQALDIVLMKELADGNITPDEKVQYETEILEVEGLPKPPNLSGIKKAELSPAAKAYFETTLNKGKLTPEELMAMGKDALDKGFVKPQELIEQFLDGSRDFMFGQPLNLVEQMAMHNYAVTISNETKVANKKLADFIRSKEYNPDLKKKLESEIKRLEDKKLEFHTFMMATNYHKGISLYLNRLMLDDEYTVANQVAIYENNSTNSEGKVPEEIKRKFSKWAAEIEEALARLAEIDEQQKAEQEAQVIENIKSDTELDNELKKESPKNIKQKSKDIADKLRKNKIKRPGIFMAATPASLAFDSAIEIAAKTIEATGSIANSINEAIKSIKNTEWYKNLDSSSKKLAEKELRNYIKAGTSDLTVSSDGKIKVPKKVIRQFVQDGVNTIEELTAKVLEKFKEDYPDIDVTERQIMDAITGYGMTKKMTEDSLNEAISIMKSVGRMISKYEDIKNGLTKPLKQNKRRALEEREKVLRRMISDALNSLPLSVEQEAEIEANRLEQYKRRQQRTLEELERRLKEGDFEKKKRPKAVALDKEALETQKKIEELKAKFSYEQELNKLKNRKIGQKIWDGFFEGMLAQKSLQLSGDLSVVRQATPIIVRMLYHNPSSVGVFFKHLHTMAGLGPKSNPFKNPWRFGADIVKSLFNENTGKKIYEDVMSEMKASEEYALAKKSGLFLIEEDAVASAKEETFQSRIIKYFPVIGAPIDTKLKIGKVKIKVPGLDIFGRGERSFSAINQLKIEEFMLEANRLKEAGITFENSPQVYKELANILNSFAGRGTWKKQWLDSIMNRANLLFISARFVKSRFDMSVLNPFVWINFARMPKDIKMVFLKKMGAVQAYRASIAGLLWLLANYDDDDETEFSLDPRDPNFFKFKHKDVTLDMGLGIAQVDALLLRTATGIIYDISKAAGKPIRLGTKIKPSGEVQQINEDEYNGLSYFDLYRNFTVNKMNYLGRKAANKVFNMPDMNEDQPEIYNFIPLPVVGGIQLSEEDYVNTFENSFFNILNIYGAGNVNVNKYKPKSTKRRNLSSEYGRINNRTNRVTEW